MLRSVVIDEAVELPAESQEQQQLREEINVKSFEWSGRRNRNGKSLRTFDREQHRKTTKELATKWKMRHESKGSIFLEGKRRIETNPPEAWSVADVLHWLRKVGLVELQDIFDKYDIDGIGLLDMTKNDFDQLGIRALAHRKKLLKEIGNLNSVSLQATNQNKKHWSSIKPIRENKVTCPDGYQSANLADGMFDEQNAHQDFQKALMEWRSVAAKPRKSLLFGGGDLDGSAASEWKNPFS